MVNAGWCARVGACLLLAGLLAACGLPRSGPYYNELVAEQPPAGYDFDILHVTPAIAAVTRVDEEKGFSLGFVEAGPVATHTIERGDVLAITVWENIDEGLLNPAGIGATPLPNAKVDERGRVFVPYVGAVQAAGRTIGQLRETIRQQLAEKTLNPQVDVFPAEVDSRMISVQGSVNAPGVYPIESATRTLLEMIAQAGGVSLDPEVVKLKLRRGNVQGDVWLQDVYDEPRNNVFLRTGDAIIAERDRRIFTALGAVAAPSTVQFPTREMSVMRALGTVGGLSSQSGDPTGVFLFRTEPVEIAERLFPDQAITEPQRVAYIIDLTEPSGMFLARDFMMRDEDTLYVTVAPFVRWLTILRGISPIISFGGSVRTLGGF